ncbi:hypothetical protein ACP4OV_004953 [Aristida adscensionis]
MSNGSRTLLRDISNCNKEMRNGVRERRGIGIREFWARKKAETVNQNQSSSASSVLCDTPCKERRENEEGGRKREERNRYQREYRARKKAELVAASASNQTVKSTIYNTPVTTTSTTIVLLTMLYTNDRRRKLMLWKTLALVKNMLNTECDLVVVANGRKEKNSLWFAEPVQIAHEEVAARPAQVASIPYSHDTRQVEREWRRTERSSKI